MFGEPLYVVSRGGKWTVVRNGSPAREYGTRAEAVRAAEMLASVMLISGSKAQLFVEDDSAPSIALH